MTTKALIEGLNEALNREVSTAIRYLLSGAKVKGAQWQSLRDLYIAEVADELGHAQYLADKIVMLGGMPSLAPNLEAKESDPRAMLERDLAEEETDVRNYMKLAALAEAEGLVDLKTKLEEQAADEASHADVMRRYLG